MRNFISRILFHIVILSVFICGNTQPIGDIYAYANSQPKITTQHNFEKMMREPRLKVKMSSQNLANHQYASTLVISCVDFRFQYENGQLLNNILGLSDDYDNIVMPGASLAVVNMQYPSWSTAVAEMIPLLQKLHKIQRIILLDHMDCGAYSLIYGKDHKKDHKTELEIHRKTMLEAKDKIQKTILNIPVYCLLMGLDGTVENFSHSK